MNKEWNDLRDWLIYADRTCRELAEKMPDDKVRLNGKAEGIRAALSKLDELERNNANSND